jgi:Phosphatidylinositol transfer protein
MLIKEYRITMPCTVDEYIVGQLHMTAKSSQEETGKTSGEGIEIVANEPYTADSPHNVHDMPPGQFTHKIMHLRSKLPSFVAMLVPVSMTDITEMSWNAFPHTKTVYSNAYFGEKFSLSVETVHANDNGNQENAVGLPPDDLKARVVEYLDIAAPDPYVKFADGEDPNMFKSTRTGRGPLAPGFRNTSPAPLMTCYKVCKLRFKVYGLQTKAESWGHTSGLRSPFLQYHRKIFCWIDQWYGMTIDDIRAMESDTARITKEKLAVPAAVDSLPQSSDAPALV